jgi:hypothetical protein
MKRKPLYVLVLALTLLMTSGVGASRSAAPPQSGTKACATACDASYTLCLASGMSQHECSGELRRCKKDCH